MKESDDICYSAHADGYIWMGLEAETEADREALNVWRGGEAIVQESSTVGRWDAQWSATGNQDMGGLGSHTYETQKVNPANDGAVEFMPEDQGQVWHYHEGVKTFGFIDYPNTGRSFHRNAAGTVTGPMPGSEAEKLLGNGEYRWNEKNQWWVIK